MLLDHTVNNERRQIKIEPKFNKFEAIQLVLNTLNAIDVKGYNNCSAVVGCVQYLNKLKDELANEDEAKRQQIKALMEKIASYEQEDEEA